MNENELNVDNVNLTSTFIFIHQYCFLVLTLPTFIQINIHFYLIERMKQFRLSSISLFRYTITTIAHSRIYIEMRKIPQNFFLIIHPLSCYCYIFFL